LGLGVGNPLAPLRHTITMRCNNIVKRRAARKDRVPQIMHVLRLVIAWIALCNASGWCAQQFPAIEGENLLGKKIALLKLAPDIPGLS